MKELILKNAPSCIFYICLVTLLGCRQREKSIESIYKFIEPKYDLIQLQPTSDTLHFQLDEHTYNSISSINVFSIDSADYISFHDKRSGSINIYNFKTRNLVKRLSLQACFSKQKLYKATVYCKNFDSIFVTNASTLNLLDTSGITKKTIDFLQKPRFAWAYFENTVPPVIKGNLLIAAVRPYVDEKSLKALRQWKVLYEFDMGKEKSSLFYNLPIPYQENFYGDNFLDYSYCYNGQGNFVFSFPADSNIYEYNLNAFHTVYYSKSQFQNGPILPLTRKNLENDEGFKQYMLRDTYGPIFYDSNSKRYLRVFKSKISQQDFEAKNMTRKQSLIIFDKDFKIIGESMIDNAIQLSSIFFSREGEIFARINSKDEYTLHFLKLSFNTNNVQTQLTQND